ncbi:MAG TPA: DUF3793 family protein [Candidatus Intestinimonas stercoravium]|uniref:DUF3793 family protein n=1 Tax=uncultured Intestinimonas sp. TaxID=1689265 RepID=UPI001F93BAA8|nr:DUF3793 family protein [uncultured Intestinimonas sp.]HJA63766.1 DUF3793 family protein [Candidatus Intestinimonas stercoravium]
MPSIEHALAFHCGPALVGMKPANLISLSRVQYPDLEEQLEAYDRQFRDRGVRLRQLSECRRGVLLLVYHSERLEEQLRAPSVTALLRRDGYPVGGGIEEMLSFLSIRLGASEDFPHEIGLFLGYPVEDVLGFQRCGGRDCKLCGYWKVYSNVERARAMFQRFDRCREALCSRLAEGMTLGEILRAA